MSYRKEFTQSYYGESISFLEIEIIEGDGFVLASCTDEDSADKIIEALNLLDQKSKDTPEIPQLEGTREQLDGLSVKG